MENLILEVAKRQELRNLGNFHPSRQTGVLVEKVLNSQSRAFQVKLPPHNIVGYSGKWGFQVGVGVEN